MRSSVFLSFILSRLVTIQARMSAVQASINSLSASCCEDVDKGLKDKYSGYHMHTHRQMVLNAVEDPRYKHYD